MLLADMGADVICIERSAPVLDLHEAPQHPHNRARILKRS
jgi:crotonobetainyl-CoA:carnitine CoA-transferase CaiB-like acyl-CoA transferase